MKVQWSVCEGIDPLIKKINLDSDNYKNYQPVSNLVFISKMIERIFLKRLHEHMNKHNSRTAHNMVIKKELLKLCFLLQLLIMY